MNVLYLPTDDDLSVKKSKSRSNSPVKNPKIMNQKSSSQSTLSKSSIYPNANSRGISKTSYDNSQVINPNSQHLIEDKLTENLVHISTVIQNSQIPSRNIEIALRTTESSNNLSQLPFASPDDQSISGISTNDDKHKETQRLNTPIYVTKTSVTKLSEAPSHVAQQFSSNKASRLASSSSKLEINETHGDDETQDSIISREIVSKTENQESDNVNVNQLVVTQPKFENTTQVLNSPVSLKEIEMPTYINTKINDDNNININQNFTKNEVNSEDLKIKKNLCSLCTSCNEIRVTQILNGKSMCKNCIISYLMECD